MKPEAYYTQARLLASSAPDGHRAIALDTNNRFEYSVAYGGWHQLVPVDGIAGQPLVVEEDRGLASYDTHNRLIPSAGTAGQLPHVNADGETFLTQRDNISSLIPVDFSDGASHSFINATIPGGSIGPHGFFRLVALAQIITNASRTVAVTVGSLTVTSNAYVSNANQVTLRIEVEGIADGTVGTGHGFALITRLTSARLQLSIFENMDNGTLTADTGNDWTLSGTIQASGAVVSQAVLAWMYLEYGYVS